MSQLEEFRMNATTRKGVLLVAEALLPGTDSLPPASGVPDYLELLERAFRADPTLEPVIETAAREALTATVPLTIELITERAGEDAERLTFALHAAYYMSKDVRDRLNYPGQGRYPVALATPDQLTSEELIAPVLDRGPIYVPTPDD